MKVRRLARLVVSASVACILLLACSSSGKDRGVEETQEVEP